MSGDDSDRAELLRKFEAAISGAEMADLHSLFGSLSQLASPDPTRPERPDLRRPPRKERALFRIRIDLDHAKPPIWRRLDVRSDLTLDQVHQVIQAAFDWYDCHLHQFAAGGHPLDQHSQLFLCPFDVEEGEDDGLPASEVRLDEILQEPGDVLRYLYDYGDSWEHTLRLEEVLPAAPDSPTATCVDGRRAAPPEDCGGITTAEELAGILDDPAHFDVEEVNESLRSPYFILSEYGVHPGLVELFNRLQFSPVGDDLAGRMLTLVSEPTEPSLDEMRAALQAHQWFLDRARGGGIELTSAGYLKPADVEAASEVVPAMRDWFGKANRENHAAPLREFRESLRTMGLLRKYKGTLLLTRAGSAAQKDPARLWQHLAARLVPSEPDTFETVAGLLLLAYAGTTTDGRIPIRDWAAALTDLGWQHQDGSPVEDFEIYRLRTFNVLINVTDERAELGSRHRISPAAAALARAALRDQNA